jgi:hypothetical protein
MYGEIVMEGDDMLENFAREVRERFARDLATGSEAEGYYTYSRRSNLRITVRVRLGHEMISRSDSRTLGGIRVERARLVTKLILTAPSQLASR